MELFVINSVTTITDCEYIKIIHEPMTSAIPITLRDFDCVTTKSALSPPPFESSVIFLCPSPLPFSSLAIARYSISRVPLS